MCINWNVIYKLKLVIDWIRIDLCVYKSSSLLATATVSPGFAYLNNCYVCVCVCVCADDETTKLLVLCTSFCAWLINSYLLANKTFNIFYDTQVTLGLCHLGKYTVVTCSGIFFSAFCSVSQNVLQCLRKVGSFRFGTLMWFYCSLCVKVCTF